jgi:hypothetical protein
MLTVVIFLLSQPGRRSPWLINLRLQPRELVHEKGYTPRRKPTATLATYHKTRDGVDFGKHQLGTQIHLLMKPKDGLVVRRSSLLAVDPKVVWIVPLGGHFGDNILPVVMGPGKIVLEPVL